MSTKTRKPMDTLQSPLSVEDAPDLTPRGPVAHVTANPPEPHPSLEVAAVLDGRLKLKRAEALMAKSEAYSLAAQLESLQREYDVKRNELQRAWERTQRKIRTLEAAIEADESTIALLRSGARSPE